MPESQTRPLGGVVQQGGGQQIRVVVAAGQQPLHDVEGMPPIRHWHRLEEGPAVGGQDAPGELGLQRADPGGEMTEELHDPMHRSSPP